MPANSSANSQGNQQGSFARWSSTLHLLTCREMKEKLNRSDLTADEKLRLYEEHRAMMRTLRAWVRQHHYNAEETRYIMTAGQVVLNIFREQLNAMKNFVENMQAEDGDAAAADDDDDDDDDNTDVPWPPGPPAAPPTWWDRTKQFGADAMKTVWEATRSLASKSFNLWEWLAYNPRLVLFVVMMLHQLRLDMCGRLSEVYGGWMEMWPKDLRTRLVAATLRAAEQGRPLAYQDPLYAAAARQVQLTERPLMAKLANTIIFRHWDILSNSMTFSLFAMLTRVPYIGAVVGPALQALLNTVLGFTKEKVQYSLTQAALMEDVPSAWQTLFELIKPMQCFTGVVVHMRTSFDSVADHIHAAAAPKGHSRRAALGELLV